MGIKDTYGRDKSRSLIGIVGGVTWLAGHVHPLRARTAKRYTSLSKSKPGPETVFQEVPCRLCGEPLVGREDNFVRKYFQLREAARVRKWRRRTGKPQPAFPLLAGAKSVTLAAHSKTNQPGGGWVLPGSFDWMHSSVICSWLFDGFTGVVYPDAYFSQAA
jgi:hypothetical protein